MIGKAQQSSKVRLAEFFGEAGAKMILEQVKDLEQTFGSASGIILKVIDGKLPQQPKKGRNNS